MNQRRKIDALKDQLSLLSLLYKLKERNFQTKRLKLQKLVYLADVFGAILDRKPTAYTFRVYKLGPFTEEIYTDIERLVSLGLTKAKEMEQWTPEQERSFKYEITEYGISRIGKILDMSDFLIREKAIEFSILVAGHLSGTNIRKLVYSEPNYMKAQKQGFESIIDPSYESAIEFKRMSKTIALEEYELKLSEDEILWLYLNFMKLIQSQ